MLLCACHQNVPKKNAFYKEDAHTGKDKDSANKPFTLQETGEKEGKKKTNASCVLSAHLCCTANTACFQLYHASSSCSQLISHCSIYVMLK